MRCISCNKHICALPIVMTKAQALEFEMPFGKHEGLKLKQIPVDYLAWLLGSTKSKSLYRKISTALGAEIKTP